MNTPILKSDEIYSDIVERINALTREFLAGSDIALKARICDKDIESLSSEVSLPDFYVLKGMVAAFRPKGVEDIHHYFMSALELTPSNDIRIHYSKALMNCYAMNDSYEVALSAIKQDQSDFRAYHLAYHSLFFMGRFSEVLSFLEKCMQTENCTEEDLVLVNKANQVLTDHNLSGVDDLINGAIVFLRQKNRSVHHIMISADTDEGSIDYEFGLSGSYEDISETYFEFITSDFFSTVPRNTLKHFNLSFVKYASNL